ncbi:phage tail tape measure protein [Streptomyces sp. DSM 41972]|uniref:Phage tail tape measure protein n=1 Tax=Streptomyces althioticus subsp. attaecolombicae TaxID=3075534 RepID=A0ABU3HW17_9ACTN|nr:phage tail tape measure protein [Streptomyces sp. DSM 41972]SCD67596.1 Phage-related minor tail protein [Streptomyces sp. di50b]SCD75730.1 Phage-related minor tail protein [Streptomyces sp. di188]
MSDTSLVFNLIARDRTGQGLSSAQERITAVASGIGAGAAAALGAGLAHHLDMEAASTRMTAQLQVGPEKAAELSKYAASVYANAWGDSAQTVNDAVKGVYQNIGDVSQAEGGIQGLTTKALALAETVGQEVGPTTAAVGQLMRTGLAKDATHAFDLIARGFSTSADKGGDFLETINEYSVQFKRVGLDGATAIGLIDQAIDAGARDSDQVADAIGQFGERALAGGTAVEAAFASIGLNADDMKAKLQAGGKSGQQALQMTTDALRNTTDHQARLNAATALFGDPGTVMGDALFALDPAGAAASSGMDKASGAMDKLLADVGGSDAKAIERFSRQAMGSLAEVAGGFAKFAMDNKRVIEPLGYALLGLAAAVLVVKAAMVTYSAGAAVVSAAHWVMDRSATKTAMGWLRMNAVGLGVYARMAAASTASALRTAAAWTGSALVSIGTWIAAVVRAGITAAAQFLLMAGRAVVWAATMAAQWFIAMGPIGWVIAAIVGLVVLVIAKWDAVKKYSGLVWSWVTKKVESAVRGVLAAVGWLAALPGRVAGFFSSMRNRAVAQALALVAWVRGLPSRISAGIGSLGSLLTGKGRSVVQGLWSGISSMGGWIKDKIIGWAKSVIPGPVAKALGIASPSKVTKAQGKWIARGLVDGLTGSSKQVRAASYKLVDIVEDALAGKRRSKALKTINKNAGWLDWLAQRDTKITANVMADSVGHHIPPGVAEGIRRATPQLDSAMQSLVRPELAVPRQPMSPTMAPLVGAQAGGVVRVVVDITGGDAELKKMFRRMVRVDGRGQVQILTG